METRIQLACRQAGRAPVIFATQRLWALRPHSRTKQLCSCPFQRASMTALHETFPFLRSKPTSRVNRFSLVLIKSFEAAALEVLGRFFLSPTDPDAPTGHWSGLATGHATKPTSSPSADVSGAARFAWTLLKRDVCANKANQCAREPPSSSPSRRPSLLPKVCSKIDWHLIFFSRAASITTIICAT
ncbi:hypothetical protein CPB85DRAFT_209882 [Mucidula mucida]|nr:hypothetical protein CPB85DRAFT_209882 [Mucidula mucida]